MKPRNRKKKDDKRTIRKEKNTRQTNQRAITTHTNQYIIANALRLPIEGKGTTNYVFDSTLLHINETGIIFQGWYQLGEIANRSNSQQGEVRVIDRPSAHRIATHHSKEPHN